MPTIRFEANATSIIRATQDLDIILAGMPALAHAIESRGRILMHAIFEEGLLNADSQGGFPEEFRTHVLSTLNKVEVANDSSRAYLSIEFNFDNLGDWGDLDVAFHQGAMLADNTRLWGPYTGQALKNEDAEERHRFWEAFRAGQTAEIQKNGKTIHMPTNKSGHDWEETKEQYVSLWGDKAPEWLYAEFGQEEWEPYIPPQNMMGEFQTSFNIMATDMLRTYVENAYLTANYYETRGISAIPVYGRGQITQARLLSGVNAGVGPSGRPRQRGQFYFKT